MLYVDFSAGNEQYKLRLSTRAIVALEKQIGCNPLSIFGVGDTVPTVTTMVNILHAAIQQYHHGITVNDAFDIFDRLTQGTLTIKSISASLNALKIASLLSILSLQF